MIRINVKTLGVVAAFAFLVGCSSVDRDTTATSVDRDATATAVIARIDQYLEITSPHTILVTEVAIAVWDATVKLRLQEQRPNPNDPRRSQLDSISRRSKVRYLDDMTTEEIVKALNTPAPIFIPEPLRTALDEMTSVLNFAIVDLEGTVAAWEVINPPPEMALLHSLNLVYFQSVSRHYEASLQAKQSLVATGDISPLMQARVVLPLDQLSDNLAATVSEFSRVSTEYDRR